MSTSAETINDSVIRFLVFTMVIKLFDLILIRRNFKRRHFSKPLISSDWKTCDDGEKSLGDRINCSRIESSDYIVDGVSFFNQDGLVDVVTGYGFNFFLFRLNFKHKSSNVDNV